MTAFLRFKYCNGVRSSFLFFIPKWWLLSVRLTVYMFVGQCMYVRRYRNFQNNDFSMGCLHVIWIENDDNIIGVCLICGNYAQLRALAEKQLVKYNVFK